MKIIKKLLEMNKIMHKLINTELCELISYITIKSPYSVKACRHQ